MNDEELSLHVTFDKAEELEASAETFLGCMIPRTWTRTRKAMTGSGDNSFSVTFGLFAHGNMAGITRATDQLPNTCKYLNGCLKQWRPESKVKWTSFSRSMNT